MKPILVTLILIILAFPAFSQREYGKIRKLDGTHRIMKVKLGADIEIIGFRVLDDSTHQYKFTNGLLKGISNDSISIKTSHVHVRHYNSDDSYYGDYEDYPWKINMIKHLAMEDISYLYYWNKSKQSLHYIGISVMVVSLVAGFIVAPLVSYDFKNNSMNTKRYRGWVIGSSIALGITIPIIALTGSKDVSFTKKGRYKFKQWEIQR